MKHSGKANSKITISMLSGILGLASVFFIIIFGYWQDTPIQTMFRLGLLSIVLILMMGFYILSQGSRIKELPYFNVGLIAAFISSFLVIMITGGGSHLSLLLGGGLIIALLFDMHMGILVNIIVVFLASYVGEYDMETIIYYLILGTFLCLLSKYMQRLSTLGYTVVIILSMQIILLLLSENFLIKDFFDIKSFYSILSSIITICISCIIYYFYNRKLNPKERFQTQGLDTRENSHVEFNTKPEVLSIKNHLGKEGMPSLEEILNTEFPLLKRLKDYSTNVYKHSLLISELSGRAARAAGVDELTTKAGGLYHEVGRIENKEYVEEGVKLGKAYKLPDIVVDIIREHNIKYDNPKSPQAAIVMLTISIIATKEYLEKTVTNSQNQDMPTVISLEKIVNNIFSMRLTKGSLDESGLTLKQYSKLKEFFLQM